MIELLAAFTPAMWLTLGLFGVTMIFQAGGFCWLAFNHFRSMSKRMSEFEKVLGLVRRDVAFLKGRASAQGKGK